MNNETSYFLFQIIGFKKYFYVVLGNNFLLFLWRPPSCGGRGQLPSLPSLKSGPEHTKIITETTPQPEPHFDQSSRFCTARGRDGRWSANLEHTTANKWLANFDERPHRSGRSFMGAGLVHNARRTELNWIEATCDRSTQWRDAFTGHDLSKLERSVPRSTSLRLHARCWYYYYYFYSR